MTSALHHTLSHWHIVIAWILFLASIDFATLVLLFSMMLIVASLHLSGFFEWITRMAIEHLGPGRLLPGVIFISGVKTVFGVRRAVQDFFEGRAVNTTEEVFPTWFVTKTR